MKKNIFQYFLVPAMALTFLMGFSFSAFAETIKIGGLGDTSGATSDVGKDYALGMSEAFKYINEKGGVNGKKIQYIWFDYGYRIHEAVTKYKFLKRMGVLAIMGWLAGDTKGLSTRINKDKLPYFSASSSARFTDPKKTRYNLFFSSDYSTNARASITAWFDKKWPKHPDYGKRKPRFAASYHFKHPFGTEPIKAIKDQAGILGFELVEDVHVTLFAQNTKGQIMALKKVKPDLVWHGNTTLSIAATIRDAYVLGLGADHIVNNWGFDEKLPRMAGAAMNAPDALTVMGVTPVAFYGQDYPKMDVVVAAAKKYNPGVPQGKRLIRTVQAWGNALILWEAMKRADKAGKLTGHDIMVKGLETMRNFDIGLGASPITFTSTDHRATAACLVQEWKDGKFQKVKRVDFKKDPRFSAKWDREWFGW